MHMSKPDPDVMRRILHRHQWSDIADWVQALDDLADLNDEEIECLASPQSPPRKRVERTQKKSHRR